MRNNPEHNLQVKVHQFVRDYVEAPHFFCSVDRAKASGKFTHVREKARGLVSGMADTILLVPCCALIAVELKAPGGKPTDRQRDVGVAIFDAGHVWAWTDSVRGYADILIRNGVRLRQNWMLGAERADAVLEGAAIKRREAKTGKPDRVRRVRPIVVPPELDMEALV